MQFLFNLFNHNETGKRSLEDVIGIMGKQMRALGHRCVWDPSAPTQFLSGGVGYNVIVEGFTPYVTSVMAEAHDKGARMIILATEEPTPLGFNHGTQAEMISRQEEFPKAAKYADAIIHLVPGQHVTDWYGQFAPAAYTELGYAPELERIDQRIEPEFDFGFYGSMTKRRIRLLKKLAKRFTNPAKAVHVVGDFPSQNKRDQEMRRAKVILQIRKFEEMGLVSSSRCATALCIGRPVVAEPHLLSKPWDEIVTFTKTDEGFIDMAMMVRATWRGTHARQFDRFKKMLPPEACVGKALEQCGIVPARVTATTEAAE